MAPYSRNRQSIADIERDLYNIFEKHPKCQINGDGEPSIPSNALVYVFESFSKLYDGEPILSEEEFARLQQLVDGFGEGFQLTPQIPLAFLSQLVKTSAPLSPKIEPASPISDEDNDPGHKRNLSDGSDSTSYYPGSRPPSRGPSTPSIKSPLDSERRKRSTPLNAPSSWTKRPTPAGRRKSDAGSRSDSEGNGPPSVWGRSSSSRQRTPSNPTSPPSFSTDLGSPEFGGSYSRPHSRTHAQPQNTFNNSFDMGYSSPDDGNYTLKGRYSHRYKNSFDNAVSTLPMPRSGSDSEDEDFVVGLVQDRSDTSSIISMEQAERVDVLQRANEELSRKLMEAETTLQNKLTEHEVELEETHQRLEELRSELTASNREEKELRTKDSRNMTQIAMLEAEVAKIQKALDFAKATYHSLQKQYQEQCSVSEKYRDELRAREDNIRILKDAKALHDLEDVKVGKEKEVYEDRIAHLERELSLARQAFEHLEEQKHQNLLLKETIDRMRFEMDEMRANATALVGANSGISSATNTLSKTLGAELLGNVKWGIEPTEDLLADQLSGDTTIVEDDTDVDEDVIQTIVKRRRKVASRAQILASTRSTFEEMKEYSDNCTQYDPALFAVSRVMQTEPEPQPVTVSFSVQTEPVLETKALPPPPPRDTVEMEIQTEAFEEEETSRSPSPGHDETLASSSSTIVPATPRAHSKQLEHIDEPPAYTQITEADEWRIGAETLKKWHHGLKIPFEPIPGGVSEEAAQEWKALKQELGVECLVIDKLVETASSSSRVKDKPRRGRFYNIYNTYVYGDKSGPLNGGLASQVTMFVAASALVILAATPYLAPQNSAVPGGPTYYDRAAWNSFNSMKGTADGFSPDGTAAVWNFLGRVGGGAARMARGWPT